ncbi:MAG TPA: PAS domain-containing protein [Thermoanaerobaculia bacterium]|nr:PAS domain-containing protein [Thermoanaerobaculia bacterium]
MASEILQWPLTTAFAAEQRAARLGNILEETTDAVLMKDLAGRYHFANRAAALLLGRGPHEVVGRSDAELLAADAAAAVRDVERRVLDAGRTLVHEETRTVDGLLRQCVSTRGVFRNVHGEVTGLFCVTRAAGGSREVEAEVVSLAAEVETPQEAALILRPFHLHAVAALLRQRRDRQAS